MGLGLLLSSRKVRNSVKSCQVTVSLSPSPALNKTKTETIQRTTQVVGVKLCDVFKEWCIPGAVNQ